MLFLFQKLGYFQLQLPAAAVEPRPAGSADLARVYTRFRFSKKGKGVEGDEYLNYSTLGKVASEGGRVQE